MIKLIYDPLVGFKGFLIEEPTYFEQVEFEFSKRWDIKIMPEKKIQRRL